MADLKYQVDIDTRAAERSLGNLKNQILGFGSAIAGAFAFKEISNIASNFQDLRTSLQFLYKDTAIGAAAFEDIKKFAAGSIFSVEDLTETIIKLKAAGLEPTVSQLRLFADTSSVAADSVGALQAITDLYARTTAGGLGLEDLNRLADRGIPVFTILSERLGLSRLEISKVGQTAGGAAIILKALEDGLNDAFGGASATRAGNVSQSLSNLGDAIANAGDTIGQSGLNQGLTEVYRSLTKIIETSKPFFEVIGNVLGKVLQGLADNMKLVVAVSAAWVATLTVAWALKVANAIGVLAKSFITLNTVMNKNALVRILSLGVAAASAFVTLSDESSELTKEIDKLNESSNKLSDSNGFKVLKEGSLGAGTANLKNEILAFNEGLKAFQVQMDGVARSFARMNDENLKAINLETQLIGTSTEIQRIRRAELDLNQRTAQEIARLKEEKAKLTEAELKEGRAAVIDNTIKKIEEQAKLDKEATIQAIKNSEARTRAFDLEIFSRQSLIGVERDIRAIQDQIATVTMSEMEAKSYRITRAAEERAIAEIKTEEIRRGSLMTDDEKLKYFEAAKKGSDELIAKEQELFDKSRQFSTGWNKAFREYADEATNAARQAERIFQRVTSSMEDMIVNFAKTGKFEFKSFINSILEELLRSRIRQLIAQIFSIGQVGGRTSSGGLVGSLLGFANGGIIPTNNAVLVGERGPEIISGAAGRVVTPNEQLGLGPSYVTYNINAVDARSFKELVAADPSFIYAVSQQGARGLPQSRR